MFRNQYHLFCGKQWGGETKVEEELFKYSTVGLKRPLSSLKLQEEILAGYHKVHEL